MSTKYTIDRAGKHPGGDLLGLEFEETDEGFVLVSPRRELALVSLVNLHGEPLMKFHVKDFAGHDWTITVDNVSPSQMGGRWCNGKDCHPGSPAEADSWTASGSGTGEGDEAQSASAGHYSH